MKYQAFSLIALSVLAACAVSPEPSYYTMVPVTGKADGDVKVSVAVTRPALAATLDRPEFVEQRGDFGIAIDRNSEWSEPLDKMFARMFADDLRQRLPNSHVSLQDDPSQDDPRFIVTLSLDHFNRMDNGDALLEGEMTTRDKTGAKPERSMHVKLSLPVTADAPSVVAGLSNLVGEAADGAVWQIKSINTQ